MLSNVSRLIVTALLVAGTAALGVPAAARAAAPASGGWRDVPGPLVPRGDSGNLEAIWMSGSSAGWTGGFTLGRGKAAPFEPLLAHLVHGAWRKVRVPLGQAVSGRINGLAGTSASDVWAVGQASTPSTNKMLIEHWNGHAWSVLPAPGVPGYPDGDLLAVAAASPDDAWAVGEAQNSHVQLHTVIEHWNGHGWQLSASPPDGSLAALTAVTVAPGGQAWAVAASFAAGNHPFVLHWNGHAWAAQGTPKAGANVSLSGVVAASPSDVWAVGRYQQTSHSLQRPYAMHWNGHSWAAASVPSPGPKRDERVLISVAEASPGHVVAVGYDPGSPTRLPNALYARWDGSRWSVANGPQDGSTLFAAATAGGTTWAAGGIMPNRYVLVPITEVSR